MSQQLCVTCAIIVGPRSTHDVTVKKLSNLVPGSSRSVRHGLTRSLLLCSFFQTPHCTAQGNIEQVMISLPDAPICPDHIFILHFCNLLQVCTESGICGSAYGVELTWVTSLNLNLTYKWSIVGNWPWHIITNYIQLTETSGNKNWNRSSSALPDHESQPSGGATVAMHVTFQGDVFWDG